MRRRGNENFPAGNKAVRNNDRLSATGQNKILTSIKHPPIGGENLQTRKQGNLCALHDEIARQTIERARGTNLIPLIDPAVRPHVADYFRGKTRLTRFGNARSNNIENQ